MRQYLSILFIIMVFVSACASKGNSLDPSAIATPDIGVKIQDHQYLEVTAPEGWNTFKTNQPISLMVQNLSDIPIVTDNDFGVRIFLLSDMQWIEIENKTVYTGTEIVIEPNKTFDPLKVEGTFVMPDLSDTSIPSLIRIFIIGTLAGDNENVEIASYIDLRLEP